MRAFAHACALSQRLCSQSFRGMCQSCSARKAEGVVCMRALEHLRGPRLAEAHDAGAISRASTVRPCARVQASDNPHAVLIMSRPPPPPPPSLSLQVGYEPVATVSPRNVSFKSVASNQSGTGPRARSRVRASSFGTDARGRGRLCRTSRLPLAPTQASLRDWAGPVPPPATAP